MNVVSFCVCLFSLAFGKQLLSLEDTLYEVKDQLSISGVMDSDLAVPLFDCLLHVALTDMFGTTFPLEEKPERVSLLTHFEGG